LPPNLDQLQDFGVPGATAREESDMWKLASGVVVAILTLWFVPQLTRQVQDRTAERDLKESIAQEIARAHTDLSGVAVFRVFDLVQRADVDAIKFNKDGSIRHPPSSKLPPKSFNKAFVVWLKRIDQIDTSLALDFPENDDLRAVYGSILHVTSSWYFLGQRPRNPTHVLPLQRAVNSLNDTIKEHEWKEGEISLSSTELQILANGQNAKENISKFYDTYGRVLDQIGDGQDAVIEHMDAAQAEGLSTTSCDLLRSAMTFEPGHCPWPGG
jgi:hypothetical protein